MTATAPENVLSIGTRFPASTVEAPARQQLPFGLFSQTTFPPSDIRFPLGGVQWSQQLPCSPNASVLDVVQCDGWPSESVLVDSECHDTHFDSFAVAVEVKKSILSMVGIDSNDYIAAYLASQEQYLVEEHTWNKLINGPRTTARGSDPVDALAQAERYLGNTGFLGVIHMSRYTATWLMKSYELQSSGDRMFTKLGTPVVVGAGYATSNLPSIPDTEDSATLFATPGQIVGYRGDLNVVDAFDVRMNDEVMRALRPYSLAWEGCAENFEVQFSLKTS